LCTFPGDPHDGMAWIGEGAPEALVMIIAARGCVKRALRVLPCRRRTRRLCRAIKVVTDGDDEATERIGGGDGDRKRLAVRTLFIAIAIAVGRTHAKLSRGDGDHFRARGTFLEAASRLQRALFAQAEGSQRPGGGLGVWRGCDVVCGARRRGCHSEA